MVGVVAVNSAQGAPYPDTELSRNLIEALVKIPVTGAIENRRLLISLVRRAYSRFPEVQELPEPRLHLVGIVVACRREPIGLWALQTALRVMAPDEYGTRRACELIESAGLRSFVPDAEVRRGRMLLRSAEAAGPDWRHYLDVLAPELADKPPDLVSAFDHLAMIGPGPLGLPALTFACWISGAADDSTGERIRSWVGDQAEHLGVPVDDLVPPIDSQPAHEGSGPPQSADLKRTDTYISAPVPDMLDSSETDKPGTSVPRSGDGDTGEGMSVATTQPQTRRLPRVWGDVPPRNPNFTGREAILARLHAALTVSREAAVLPQALHGMGGVGKSQVAIEYVHRHSSEYDLVWWISAEQNSQVLSSLIRLAQQLGLDVAPEANSAVPAVRDALNTGRIEYERWLLVFDNAESLQGVRQYFPTAGAGKVLVTSRNPEWAGVARTLEVDVFTRDESKAFLKNRTPELTDEDADRLADALGDLPLAVEQAAAWHATTGMPVDQYLHLLNQKRIELLDDLSTSDSQTTSVAAAWNVSLDRLDQTNRAALQLLQVCSFFSPEPISREFFAAPSASPITEPLDDALRDPIKLGRSIRDIQRYALAKLNHQTNTLQIHRLVQAVLEGRMDQAQADLMRSGAHALLAGANPHSPERGTQWERYQSLLPHVRASRAVRSTDPNVMRLVFDTVRFLYHWGDHTGSLALAEEAYQSWLDQLGEEHQQTLRLAKFLGYARALVGDFEPAVELFNRTRELYTAQSDEDDEDDEETLDALLLVAYGQRITGEFQQALELDERAYQICHRLFGEDDPVTLRAANNVGVSLRLNGQYARAAELDQQTYLRRMDVLGSGDGETLRTLNNLIIDQRESGDFMKARAQQEDCLERARDAFGYLDNPAVLFASRNLAVARRKAGEHSGALILSDETAERYRRRYGPDHPDTMAADLNLAIDQRHAGDLKEAQRLGLETLGRYRKTLGPDHPHTLAAQVNLAIVVRQQGDAKAAYRSNKEARAALTERLGPDHPTTLTCATNLASDLFALGDGQAAFDLDTDTLARSERVLGVEHPSTLAVGVNLALDLRALGREQEADLLHADNMARFRRSLGDQHPATLNALKSSRADCDLDPMPL